MTFNFTQEELSCIVKMFKYKHLEGFDEIDFDKDKCIKTLQEKMYISPYRKSYELSNEVRFLLSVWKNIRYTIIREDFISDDHVFAILANSEYIFSYSFHGDDIQINLCDYSAEVMDKLLADYLDIVESSECSDSFNISFSGEEFSSYFAENSSNELISKKTGLPPERINLIKNAIVGEVHLSFIVQDIFEDIGCMGIIEKHDNGYIMVKHIVPNRHINKQKVVVVNGSDKDIIDSIYVL